VRGQERADGQQLELEAQNRYDGTRERERTVCAGFKLRCTRTSTQAKLMLANGNVCSSMLSARKGTALLSWTLLCSQPRTREKYCLSNTAVNVTRSLNRKHRSRIAHPADQKCAAVSKALPAMTQASLDVQTELICTMPMPHYIP
jgi:hypothetical protein